MLDGLFINSSSVTGTPIRLDNNQFLRSRNAADTGDINILKINSLNQVEFASIPIVTGQGRLALLSDVSDYSSAIAALQSSVTSLELRVTALEENVGFLQSDVNILNTSMILAQQDITALQNLQDLYLLLDGTRPMTGDLNLDTKKIINLADPTSAQDAATKAYVDSQTSDISSLEARVTALEADVITLNTDVGNILTDVNSLQAQVLSINVSLIGIEEDISDLNDLQSTYLLIDGTRSMTGDLNLNTHKIINLVDPVNPQDAVTKAYADSLVANPITASNLGTGEGVFSAKVGSDLQFKSLVAGSNVTLLSDAETITISTSSSGISGIDVLSYETPIVTSATVLSFGFGLKVNSVTNPQRVNIDLVDEIPAAWITNGVNNGGGAGVFKEAIPSTMYFRSLVAGSNVSIAEGTDTITISANSGISSIGINKDGIPVLNTTTLNFVGSNITITDNAGVADISITSGGGSTVDYLQFNLTPSSVPADPGTLYWDQADGNQTLSLNMAGGNVIQQIGEEFYVRVKATSPISEGQVVMIDGTVGTSGVYLAAPAAGITDGHIILGVATENIATNDFGYVTTEGLVRGIITDGTTYGETWIDGDELFWNPNPIYPGGLTNVKPLAPNVKASIGSVVKSSNGMSGSIYIRLNPGSQLGGTDSNVQFGTLSPYDFIAYDDTLGYWRNFTTTEVASIFEIEPTPVYDEGIQITSDIGSVNFTGAGVTATSDINGNVTVNIPGGGGGGASYADIEIPVSLDINWQSATTYHLDINSNTTFTFSNLVEGKTIYVILNNTSGLAVNATFPTTIAQDGLDEVVFANSHSVYMFIYSNGNIYASVVYNMV